MSGARRRCCCLQDCAILRDGFDRALSDDPGPNWVEDSGDWDIIEGDEFIDQVVAEQTGSGVLQTTVRSPHTDGSGYAEVRIHSTNGGTYRIAIDKVDANNYHYVEITVTGEATTVAWGKRTAGGDDELGSTTEMCTADLHSDCWIAICIEHSNQNGSLRTIITPLAGCGPEESPTSEHEYYSLTTTHHGRYAGLINKTGDVAKFDAFYWEVLETPSETCEICSCIYCGRRDTISPYHHEPMPKRLLFTIEDVSGCEELDGLSVEAVINEENCEYFGGEDCTCWRSVTWITLCGETTTIELARLSDEADLPWYELFELFFSSFVDEDYLENASLSGRSDSICYPIDLVFGPFVINEDFECCDEPGTSTFQVRVTEVP